MDEDRLDALLQRAAGPAQSKEDEVSKALDFLVWSLAKGPRPNRDTIAKARAKVLAKRPEMWANYVVLSETSPLAWKTLQVLVTDLWSQDPPSVGLFFAPGEVAISPLLCWSLDVAAGKRKEPKKPGPDPTKNYYRDSAIALTVEEIVSVGGIKAPAACDRAVERLKEEGYKRLSYETVYNTIWLPHNKRRKDEPPSRKLGVTPDVSRPTRRKK